VSLGRARKSVEPDPLAPYTRAELELVTAEFRAQRAKGEPITNLETAAAARRAGFSVSTMRRRVREDPQLKPKPARLTRELRIQIVLRNGNVARTYRELKSEGWPDLPSERTLQMLVRALPLAEAVSLRKGEGEARKRDLVLLRMLTDRNQAWFMDAFHCRRLVTTANGRGLRHALAILVVDGASGLIGAVTAFRAEPRADGTVSKVDSYDALHAIGDAMRPWSRLGPVRGRPLVLYHDNANYFTSELFQLPLADPLLRVKTETTGPYTPWQNGPAESTVGSLRKLVARPLQNGTYLDLSGTELVDIDRRAVDLPRLQAELVAAAIEFNQMPFRGDRSMSKVQAYETLLPGELNPVPREILTRFLRVAKVPVYTSGVAIEREKYQHSALYGGVGRVVQVRYHDMDDSEVEVWRGGQRLCIAKNVRDFTEDDREKVLFPRASSRIGRQNILNDAAAIEDAWAEKQRADLVAAGAGPAAATDADPWGDDTGDA
jgi:transposase InsO family protein